ncbi:MAG: GNA1162 family protein [Planctomycetota bacterium]
MKKYFFAFIFIALFIVSSCNYIEERSTPNVKTLHPLQKNEITTVAILPFKNKSEKKGAEEILRKCFFTNFSAKGYNLLKPEEVDERLNLAAIDLSNLDNEDVYKVGRIVKADAVIFGTVTKCTKKFFGVYSQVVLGAEMKMVDVKSSKVIWQAEHTEKTHSDAIPVSPFSIPEAVVDSSMNVREKVITDTADRLVKKFIISIPSKDFSSPINASVISIKPIDTSMGVYYRVQNGDTLQGISVKFYDDMSRTEDISNANNGVSNETLRAGQELIIPDMPIIGNIEEIQQINKKKYKKTVYRVKWGDSLYNIASKVFRDGKRWTIIYDANKSEIRDIKDLPVGQVLIIPLTTPKTDSFKRDL